MALMLQQSIVHKMQNKPLNKSKTLINIRNQTMKKSIIAAAIMAAFCFTTSLNAQTDQQKKCDGKVKCEKTEMKCEKAGKCCKAKKTVDATTSATAQSANEKMTCCKDKTAKKAAKAAKKAKKNAKKCDKCETK